MAGFLRKIQGAEQKIRWLNPPMDSNQKDGSKDVAQRKVIRLYDPDGHVIEVAGY